jgi:hexosaminidase
MNSPASPPVRLLRSRRARFTAIGAAVAVAASLSGSIATASYGSSPADTGAVPLTQVVPSPTQVQTTPGVVFSLQPGDAVYATSGSADAAAAAGFLAGLLRKPTGYPVAVRDLPAGAQPRGIVLALGGAGAPAASEAYQLDVTAQAVTVRAGDRQGLFNGVQTLRQLLPVKVERQVREPGPWLVQGGRVVDQPRYGYRGALLDVARHFLPVADVQKYIDGIARYKINYLHLHLVDDQGWRIEIKGWPELTAIGGSTGVGDIMGGSYTQADYQAIVRYAAARGVTVIPEIEGPAHMQSALASYAKLTCDGKPVDLYTGFTPSPDGFLCLSNPTTYEFLDDVIGQLAALTPGPYLHIGGDETQDIPAADVSNHVEKVEKLVRKHGKKVIGWQDIAGSLDPATSLTGFWAAGINDDQVVAAAKAGQKVVMSPSDHLYLDMKYTEAVPEYPIGNSWAGTSTVADSYDWKPEAELPGLPATAIAGVEADLWTETVFGIGQAENLAFPRLLSAAEIGWAQPSTHNWDSYRKRLAAQGPRLREGRVNYYLSPEVPWPLGS